MNKKKKKRIILIVAIVLGVAVIAAVLLFFAATGLFGTPEPEYHEPTAEEIQADVSGKYVLTDPLADYYDPLKSSFDVSWEGLVFEVKDVEVTKEIGDLSFDYLLDTKAVLKNEKEDVLGDEEGFLSADYSFVKVRVSVTNAFQKESGYSFDISLLSHNMEMLESGTWERGNQKWAGRFEKITMTGENEFDDDYHHFMWRTVKPGETKEFEIGILVEDRFLNSENNYFLEVYPAINPDLPEFMAGIRSTEQIPSEKEIREHGGIDSDYRYICLNQFLDGYEPFRMPLDASKRETWKHFPFYYRGEWDDFYEFYDYSNIE